MQPPAALPMAAASQATTTLVPLPAKGSLYWDYLNSVFVGASIEFDLMPDGEAHREEGTEGAGH